VNPAPSAGGRIGGGSVNLIATTLIVLASIAVAVGVFLVLRRFAPAGGFFNDGDRAAGVFGVLATGFSVLLGFVVYLAFTTYDTALAGAQLEATDVIQQYETAQLMPKPVSRLLAGELVCYGRSVVYAEWPQLQDGKELGFNPWGVRLFRTLQAADPKTPVEQAAYSKWLDQTSDREQARLDRVQPGDGVIPGPLWLILFVTGGLVALFAFLFTDPEEHWLPQAVIAGSLAAMLAVSLLVIGFLNHPYSKGTGSIKPKEMQKALNELAAASAKLGIKPPIPCNASGRPL
jgi:hypothetical protein